MELRAADFRRQSKNALTGKWGLAIGTYLVASLLGGASSPNFSFTNMDFNIGSADASKIIDIAEIPGTTWAILGGVLLISVVFGMVISLALLCIGSIVNIGYSQFNLNIIDNKEATFSQLFGFFKYWSVAIVTSILRFLYTFLWTLLFIIPGIIAAYSYSMTPYILAENPDMSPNDAITRSKEMMVGNKWRLFCLELSFIGWDILCVLTLGILSFWILPWKQAATAAFYRSLAPLSTVSIEEINLFGDFNTNSAEKTTI